MLPRLFEAGCFLIELDVWEHADPKHYTCERSFTSDGKFLFAVVGVFRSKYLPLNGSIDTGCHVYSLFVYFQACFDLLYTGLDLFFLVHGAVRAPRFRHTTRTTE